MKYIGSERDSMRQGQQNRRGRGRNNTHNQGQSFNQGPNPNNNNNQNRKPQSQLSKNYESSGPDVKIRGTAHHIAEKYTHLARDAASAGDFIVAENYLQHAEHYNRIIMAAQPAPIQHVPHSQSPQPYIQGAQTGEQPAMPPQGNRLQIEDRNMAPPVNGAAREDDGLPGFLTQPVQIPDAGLSRRAERPERAPRPERAEKLDATDRAEGVERSERDDTVVRARRRRRPANGPEGLMADKPNGHINGNVAVPLTGVSDDD